MKMLICGDITQCPFKQTLGVFQPVEYTLAYDLPRGSGALSSLIAYSLTPHVEPAQKGQGRLLSGETASLWERER